MNTTKLAKHYGSLSVIERLRMIHDAYRRDDTSEIQNLNHAAPFRYSMTDTARFESYLRLLCTFRYCDQLEIVADFWHAQTRASWALEERAEAGNPDQNPDTDQELKREFGFWRDVVTCMEFRYILERDGWNLFIQQSGFDVTRIDLMPRSWLIDDLDEHATVQADIQDALKRLTKNDEPIILRTPADVAKDWHEAVRKLANNELN